jgi:hypothetical protein
MSAPLTAGLPPDLDIGDGYTIRFLAVDPTSGAPVTGVTVSNVSIFATDLAGTDLSVGPFLLVPGPSA